MKPPESFHPAPRGCTDPRLGRYLARYELEALNEVERKAFLDHLLQCEACHEEIFSFEEVAALLRPASRSARHRDSVSHPVDGFEREGADPQPDRPSKPTQWRRWMPVAAAILLTALSTSLLVFQDSPNPVQPQEISSEISATLPDWSPPTWENLPADDRPLLRSIGGPMAAGRDAWRRGDYETAAEQLDAALRLDDSQVNAWFYRGVALLRLGKAEEALHPLRRAQRLAGGEQRLASRYYLGIALAVGNQKEEAREIFNGLLQDDPDGLWDSQARKFLEALEAPPNLP
ncbi:MAG: tetratricopeptide repeat protein [Acidobacteriota bacterium]